MRRIGMQEQDCASWMQTGCKKSGVPEFLHPCGYTVIGFAEIKSCIFRKYAEMNTAILRKGFAKFNIFVNCRHDAGKGKVGK